MSDFSAILELLAKLVAFVIKWTLNLICLCIYLASMVLPWRLVEELNRRDNYGDMEEWRCNAIVSLLLTIYDAIAIPLGLISLASILRWRHISEALNEYTLREAWELRHQFILSFFYAGLDFVALFCFVIQHCFPFRIHLVYFHLLKPVPSPSDYVSSTIRKEKRIIRLALSSFLDAFFFLPGMLFTAISPALWGCTRHGLEQAFTPLPNSESLSSWDECYWFARCVLLSRVPYALYDLFCLPLAALALLSPFRHTAFRIALVENGLEFCAFGLEETPLEEIPQHGQPENYGALVPEVSVTILGDDAPSAPPGVVSEEMDEAKVNSLSLEIPADATSPSLASPSAPTYSDAPSPPLPVTTLRNFSPTYNELYYNTILRRECVYFGVTALVDFLLLPILLPLIITWYRYSPIREQLFPAEISKDSPSAAAPSRKRPKPWGFREYGIISRQFCFLFLDLIFLPLLLATFLTQYRWLPVAIVREKDDLVSFRSLAVYATLLWTLVLMAVDLVVLPFAALVVVTWYRFEPLRIAFENKRIRFGFALPNSVGYSCCNDNDDDDCCETNFSAFYIHLLALCNFLVVLHDLVVVPVFLSIGLLSGVRTMRTLNLIQSALASIICTQPSSDPPAPVSVSAPAMSDLEQATPQSLVPTSSTVPRHYSQLSRDGNSESIKSAIPLDYSTPLVYPDLFPASYWRIELYFEAMNSLLDLPFVVLALCVVCTGWRTTSLLRALAALEEEYKSYSWYHHRNSDDLDFWCCDCCCCFDSIDINWKRRKVVVKEFFLLLRDILFLIPLAVIIATLYRLPGLLLDLVSRCFPINRTVPRLVPTGGKILVPDNHGPISIHLTCKPVRDSDISSLSYSGPAKMFVDGANFWSEIGRIFGDSIMRVGKGMLPLKLTEGIGVAHGVVQLKKSNDELPVEDENTGTSTTVGLQGREDLLEVWIKLDLGTAAKRTTILKNLRKLNQNTRMIIQLEAQAASGKSPVVVSVTPTIDNLVRIFNLETQNLEAASLDEELTQRSSLISSLPESGGIVEDFWIIVALHIAEILMDLAHLFLFLFVCLVPWRVPQLICSLLESNIRSTWREAMELYHLHCDTQKCLSQYLAEMAPLANSLAKSVRLGGGYRVSDFTLFTSEEDSDSYVTRYNPLNYFSLRQIHSRLKRVEEVSLKRFEKDSEKVVQRAAKGTTEIQEFGHLLSRHRELQFMRLAMWGFRCSANMMKEDEVALLCSSLETQSAQHSNGIPGTFTGVFAEIVSHFDVTHKAQEKEQEALILNHLLGLRHKVDEESRTVSFWKRWNGLSHRSSNELRKIIRSTALRALRDLGIFFLFLFLVVTLVKILPLVKDLRDARSWSMTSPTTHRIIMKHLRGFADDTKRLFKFLFFATAVVLLGVGIPSFLRELPRRFRSLEDATDCAKQNLRNTIRYFCEVLALFAAWKTYKLVVTAAIYSVLVPPACLAEAIPRRFSSVQLRFMIGIMVWFGLGIGAIMLSVGTNHWEDEENSAAVRRSFLILYGLLMAVILVAAGSLSRRSEYTSPIKESATGFISPSWSHFLSLLLGPLESLQLSSVVLYFFWHGTGSYLPGGGGAFTFPVVFLFQTGTSDPDSFGYSLALGLAAVCVLIWVVIVSIPLVYDSPDKNLIRSFQQNPAFDATYSFLSRIVFVSIAATLLRPYSCVAFEDSLVLSTNPNQLCGGNDSAQNRFSSDIASSLLLLFFMLTSTIFHSDAPDLLSPDDPTMNSIDSFGQLDDLPVRFAPLYAIVIRLGQFAICFFCFGFASLSDRRSELLVIIALSFVMFAWVAFYPWGRGCSIPSISILRAVGFLVVMWTSIVCYCRDEVKEARSDAVAWTGYVGLLIAVLALWFAGVGVAVFIQLKAARTWMTRLREGGLDAVIGELVATANLVLVEDAIGGGTREGKQTRKEAFVKECQQILTASGLGLALVRFEEKILADRLSPNFILNRPSWRRILLRGSELTYESIITQVRLLKEAIVPRPAVALLNKHVLATILENKLPEYVAWEVFKYLYDIAPLQQLLSPLMTLTAGGERPPVLQQSYARYTWWYGEAYTVTLLRLTKKLLYETITSVTTQGRKNPPAPPSATTRLLLGVRTPPRGEEEVENLVMDREWACSACTLSNPSSRTTCDACGLERDRPRRTSF